MKCNHCGHETEEGKFCTNCGSPLEQSEKSSAEPQEKTEPVTAENQTASEDSETNVQTVQEDSQDSHQSLEPVKTEKHEEQAKQTKKPDFGDQLATVFTNFGHFFMTLVKQPSQAKKANHHDSFSALITIVAFAIIISMSIFIPHAFMARTSWLIPRPSMFYEFLVPLFLIIILFAGIISLIFVSVKLTKLDFSYLTVLGKFGAYLLPYVLVFIAGIILSASQIPVLPYILFMISIVGPFFVIPALILYEKESAAFDRVYTLLALYFVEFLFLALLANSIFGSVLRNFYYFLP